MPHFDQYGGDTWLCQAPHHSGNRIQDSRVVSQWRPDITGLQSAGNCCPACVTSLVIDEIGSERIRQLTVENWSIAHDDEHTIGEMAMAASCYALNAARTQKDGGREWPWDLAWWKPKNPRCDLIRAAALIVAEIERLDRESHRGD